MYNTNRITAREELAINPRNCFCYKFITAEFGLVLVVLSVENRYIDNANINQELNVSVSLYDPKGLNLLYSDKIFFSLPDVGLTPKEFIPVEQLSSDRIFFSIMGMGNSLTSRALYLYELIPAKTKMGGFQIQAKEIQEIDINASGLIESTQDIVIDYRNLRLLHLVDDLGIDVIAVISTVLNPVVALYNAVEVPKALVLPSGFDVIHYIQIYIDKDSFKPVLVFYGGKIDKSNLVVAQYSLAVSKAQIVATELYTAEKTQKIEELLPVYITSGKGFNGSFQYLYDSDKKNTLAWKQEGGTPLETPEVKLNPGYMVRHKGSLNVDEVLVKGSTDIGKMDDNFTLFIGSSQSSTTEIKRLAIEFEPLSGVPFNYSYDGDLITTSAPAFPRLRELGYSVFSYKEVTTLGYIEGEYSTSHLVEFYGVTILILPIFTSKLNQNKKSLSSVSLALISVSDDGYNDISPILDKGLIVDTIDNKKGWVDNQEVLASNPKEFVISNGSSGKALQFNYDAKGVSGKVEVAFYRKHYFFYDRFTIFMGEVDKVSLKGARHFNIGVDSAGVQQPNKDGNYQLFSSDADGSLLRYRETLLSPHLKEGGLALPELEYEETTLYSETTGYQYDSFTAIKYSVMSNGLAYFVFADDPNTVCSSDMINPPYHTRSTGMKFSYRVTGLGLIDRVLYVLTEEALFICSINNNGEIISYERIADIHNYFVVGQDKEHIYLGRENSPLLYVDLSQKIKTFRTFQNFENFSPFAREGFFHSRLNSFIFRSNENLFIVELSTGVLSRVIIPQTINKIVESDKGCLGFDRDKVYSIDLLPNKDLIEYEDFKWQGGFIREGLTRVNVDRVFFIFNLESNIKDYINNSVKVFFDWYVGDRGFSKVVEFTIEEESEIVTLRDNSLLELRVSPPFAQVLSLSVGIEIKKGNSLRMGRYILQSVGLSVYNEGTQTVSKVR